jgi:hypothetical protein
MLNLINNKKGKPLMISTAIAIQDATRDAVHDESVMDLARAIYQNKDTMDSDDFAKAIFMYSAHLSAMTATLVTHAILTESQINDMVETIKEMEAMGEETE